MWRSAKAIDSLTQTQRKLHSKNNTVLPDAIKEISTSTPITYRRLQQEILLYWNGALAMIKSFTRLQQHKYQSTNSIKKVQYKRRNLDNILSANKIAK